MLQRCAIFRGMKAFEIRFLDHVAIRVRDIETSANWYEKILGLKRMNIREWGDFPVLMSCGKTGIAIFPANLSDPKNNLQSKNTGISHFAFNLSYEDFNKAKENYKELALEFEFQDHFYFHSIYIQDPDGHTVELTTIVVDEDAFYK